jgi:Protein of unknown function (DUF3568)
MASRPLSTARWIALAAALAYLLSQEGCATMPPLVEQTNAPAGGFSAGRAQQDFPRDPKNVSVAVTEALDDLKMTSIKRERTGTVYKIEARSQDDRSVLVTVRPHQDQSRVGCRIGWFGDEPLSRTVLERVGIRLDLLPPAPIPENPPSSPAANPFFARDPNLQNDMIRDMMDAPYRGSGP